MIVAEIHISVSKGFSGAARHGVTFADAAGAKTEYEQIAAMLEKRSERGNDVPKLVKLSGITEFSAPLEDITSVSLVDFAINNEHMQGMADRFPHMFKS